ncbi:MAG: hypothetical protein ACWGQW_08835 [bacterium]
MKELDAVVYKRMSQDDDILNLLNAAGNQPPKPPGPPYGNAWGYKKISHKFQKTKKELPSLNYNIVQMIPGQLTGNHCRTLTVLYEFSVFAKNYFDIL